jgi:hypothetical protein
MLQAAAIGNANTESRFYFLPVMDGHLSWHFMAFNEKYSTPGIY